MEIRTEVKIRNKHTGAETILCTNISKDDALKWVNFSILTADPNDLPEYVIRPYVSNDRREKSNGNVATAKQVQKPEG